MEELLAPAVTVTVVPVIEHADEVAVVLCTCAMQACQVAEVNVAVHDVQALIVQLKKFPPRCWPFV